MPLVAGAWRAAPSWSGRWSTSPVLARPRPTSQSAGASPDVRPRTALAVPCSAKGWRLAPSSFVAAGTAVLGQADRAAPDLRRPSGHRHRERAAVQGAAGAKRELTEALEQQTATAEILRRSSELADRRAAGLRDDRRRAPCVCAAGYSARHVPRSMASDRTRRRLTGSRPSDEASRAARLRCRSTPSARRRPCRSSRARRRTSPDVRGSPTFDVMRELAPAHG